MCVLNMFVLLLMVVLIMVLIFGIGSIVIVFDDGIIVNGEGCEVFVVFVDVFIQFFGVLIDILVEILSILLGLY